MKKFLKYRTHDVAFGARMPAGIPGDLTRKQGSIVEARQFDATNPPAVYGVPVVIETTGGVRKVLSTDTSASIYGFILRPFPISNINTTDGLGTSGVNTNFPADIARKGYIDVVLQNSTAAALAGQVYVRAAATSGSLLQGGIEAAASSTIAAAAKGGITGNGTCTALSVKSAAMTGVYKVIVEIAGTNSATWNLYSPDGDLLDQKQYSGSGSTAVFSNPEIGFTITDGSTDFVVGDEFDITVTLVNIAVPNCTFMGAADSTGNVEISYKM